MLLFWKRNFSLENSCRCKSAARTETWLPKRLRNLSLAQSRRVIIHGEKRNQCCQELSYPIENTWFGNAPVVWWLGLCAFTAEGLGPIPGKREHLRFPGEGNGNPLQYPCLENLMDRGDWRVTVHGAARAGHDLVTKPPPIYWKIVQSFQDLWKASKHCEKNQCNTSPLLFFHFSFWFLPPTTFSLGWGLIGLQDNMESWKAVSRLEVTWTQYIWRRNSREVLPKSSLPPDPGRCRAGSVPACLPRAVSSVVHFTECFFSDEQFKHTSASSHLIFQKVSVNPGK